MLVRLNNSGEMWECDEVEVDCSHCHVCTLVLIRKLSEAGAIIVTGAAPNT